MGYDIATAAADQGIGTAGNIVNAGLGLVLGGINDKRQLKQQKKLQDLQIAGNMQMTDYNMQKQLQMWKDTSYGAQVEQMEKAGINPGLMYGMSGGGGQTTGNASGNVQGASAPQGGGEAMAMTMAGIQSRLQEAQLRNLEAQTTKTQAEAEKIAGVDTGLTRTQILDLTVGIDNKRAQAALTQVQTELGKIDQEVKGRTVEDQVRIIERASDRALEEVTKLRYENAISMKTWETTVEKIQAELVGTYLHNVLTGEQITKTTTEIQAISEQLVQGWHKLNIDFANANTQRGRLDLDKAVNDLANSTKLKVETIKGIVQAIFLRGTR